MTLEKLELQGGTANFKGAATLVFDKRLRGEPLTFDQKKGWVRDLQAVGGNDKLVILYDTREKRAWLVDAYSALMHLFRASLQNDSEGRSPDLYWHSEAKTSHLTAEQLFSNNQFNLAKLDYLEQKKERKREQKKDQERSSSVPFAILKSRKFCSQELHRQGYGPTSTGIDTDTHFNVADRIGDLVEGLEKFQTLVANPRRDQKEAFYFPTSSTTVLEGYDFWDLARLGGAVTIQPKAVKLHEIAKGWLNFTRDTKAITLFGSGFGDILRPVGSNNESCKRCLWNMQVPSGKDILALTVADLEYLHRRAWRTEHTGDRMVLEMFPWKDPAGCFNPCRPRVSGTKATCFGPLHMQAFMPPPGRKDLLYSKVKTIARNIRHPGSKQPPSASRGENFCRGGGILLGVPDGDLLRGKVEFAAPEDDTPTEGPAYPAVVEEGQRAPSESSATDRDTRASATSPSETQDSSMTTHTSRTDSSMVTDETEMVTLPTTVTGASGAKQKERAHGLYPNIDQVYQILGTRAEVSDPGEGPSGSRS